MRRRAAPKRDRLPDPLYQSGLVSKFINHLMLDGKKSLAEKIVYGAIEQFAEQYAKRRRFDDQRDGDDDGGESGAEGGHGKIDSKLQKHLVLFEKVINDIRPFVEVKSRRVGGATYQVPVEVRPDRRTALAMRWLVEFARKRGEKTMTARLANEMMDIMQGRGATLKKRSDVHQMAKANQAFAHFNWQKS
jgi:small subunit ribosomal protein S7